MADPKIISIVMLVVLFVSLVLHLVSFGSYFWVEYRHPKRIPQSKFDPVHFGLWKKRCNRFICKYSELSDWQKGGIATMILALLCIISSVVGAALYIFLQKLRKKMMALVVVATAFGAALFSMVALGLCGDKTKGFYQRNLAWSFYLAALHCALSLVGGILGVLVWLWTTNDG